MPRKAIIQEVPPRPIQIYKADSFAGGLNTRDPSNAIADNESPDLQNVSFGGAGSVKKRSGTNIFGDDFGNNKILGLTPFYYGSGTKEFVAIAGTDAYVEDSGTWTSQSLTLTASKQAFFEQFIDSGSNETLIMVNGAETKDYTGSAWANLGGTPPSGTKYIKAFMDRLYLANNSTNPNRVWYSAVGNSESWDTGAGGDWFNVPAVKDGDDITGLGLISGGGTERLIIFKRYSIWAWDTNRLLLIKDNIGCIATRTIVNVDNSLFFLSYTDRPKVMALSGGQVFNVGDKISTSLNSLSTGQITGCAAIFFDNKYYLSCPSSSASNNDQIFVLDRSFNAWTKYTNINAAILATFRSSNTEELYYGEATANSVIIKMETGTADYDQSAATQTADIVSYFKTKNFDFNQDIQNKRFENCYVIAVTQSVSTDLKIIAMIDYGNFSRSEIFNIKTPGDVYGTAIYGTSVYGGQTTIENKMAVKKRGKFIQYSFENRDASEPWEVYALRQTHRNLPIK